MNSKMLMSVSAVLLLAHGLVLLFAAELLCMLFGIEHSPQGLVAGQFIGTFLIAAGLMNWIARGLVLGGIFGRAVVNFNFVYSLTGFFVSLRAALNGFGNTVFLVEIVLLLASAMTFGIMLFRGPISRRES